MTTLDAEDFGLIGDGQTDNSSGFLNLRNTIRDGADRRWLVEFDPGHYAYTDNTWWNFGDRDVTLNFNNARIENMSTFTWSRSWGIFPGMNPHIYWPNAQFTQNSAVLPEGYLFKSVYASSREIELTQPVTLAPGDLVFLCGDLQQIRDDANGDPEAHGFPPNCRIFEYARVESQDGNKVQLQYRIRHEYDDTWPDWSQTPNLPTQVRLYGKPRLFLTKFSEWQLGRRLVVNDVIFVGNRNKDFTSLNFVGLNVKLVRCKVEGNDNSSFNLDDRMILNMSHTDLFEAIECEFLTCAPDKLNRRARFTRCIVNGAFTGQGAGIESMILEDCDIMGTDAGRGIDHGPRDTVLKRVLVHGRSTFSKPPTVSRPGPIILGGDTSTFE